MTARINVVKYEPTDPRLGRHVEHDARSWQYKFLGKTVRPKKITTHWPSKAPAIDQGNYGSCTGNAEVNWFNTDVNKNARLKVRPGPYMTEIDAVHLYSLGTHLDNIPGSFPPDDTGSTGNAVCKAGVKLGWLQSYSWLFSFSSLQAAVEKTPVMVGTLWTNNMFDYKNGGILKVGKLTDSNIAGGHEYLCNGVVYDNTNSGGGLFEFRNSWGEDYDKFAITFKDFLNLLEADGDATVPQA